MLSIQIETLASFGKEIGDFQFPNKIFYSSHSELSIVETEEIRQKKANESPAVPINYSNPPKCTAGKIFQLVNKKSGNYLPSKWDALVSKIQNASHFERNITTSTISHFWGLLEVRPSPVVIYTFKYQCQGTEKLEVS